MTEDAVLDLINGFEKHHPVDQWKINDIEIWPLLRLRIGNYLFEEHKDNAMKMTNRLPGRSWIFAYGIRVYSVIKVLIQILQMLVLDKKNDDSCTRADVLAFFYNVDRNIYVKEKKGWYNYILEPVCDELIFRGIKLCNIELLMPGFELKYPRTSKTKVLNFDLLTRNILFKFRKKNTFKENLSGFDAFLSECDDCGINTDRLKPHVIGYEVLALQSEAAYYEQILKKLGVRMALVPDWRNFHCMALTYACKKHNIPCVEIQHGYYGQRCFTHSSWRKQPSSGYLIKPDYYWCWTKQSAVSINNELPVGKAISAYPPMKLFWQSDEYALVKDSNNVIDMIVPKGMKIVLVSLQNVMPKDVYPEWLIDLVYDTQNEYFWLFRKHISSERSGQDEICDMLQGLINVEWENSSELPLDVLLSRVDVHVTLFSSVVVEAALSGVPSIFLAENYKDRFGEQIETEIARYADSKESMLELLAKFSNKSYPRAAITKKPIDELIDILNLNR